MSGKALLETAIQIIQEKTQIIPKVGIILGSGLSPLADEIDDAVHIPYEELPGLPLTSVHGHSGELVIGTISNVPVACLKGRVHYYEGAEGSDFKALIRLLKLLGCTTLLVTNASGSLRQEVGPGELVIINDHINFQFKNPLIGPNDEEFGPRFFPMDRVYDADLRKALHTAAEKEGVQTHEGVYIAVLGPNFETPAEIRAFRLLGADVVGMSTVPDVLVAAHCGFRVALISTITNFSADLFEKPITHDVTLSEGKKASGKLIKLVKRFLQDYEF